MLEHPARPTSAALQDFSQGDDPGFLPRTFAFNRIKFVDLVEVFFIQINDRGIGFLALWSG